MRISAVILNYGRVGETLACVASLERDAPHVRAIVVDNGSPEEDRKELVAGLPGDVTLLESDQNLGYAGGNNLGMRLAMRQDAEAILVLNNDVEVLPGCVQDLVDSLDSHPRWGVAGPLSLLASDPNTVDFFRAGIDLPHIALTADGRDGPVSAIPVGEHETDYVTGSAMLIRRIALEQVGFFDERFFLVWEDVDLCVRMTKAGWGCGVNTQARVLHARSATFGSDGSPLHRYFFARNSFLIVRKHVPVPARWKSEIFGVRRYLKWSAGVTPLHRAIRRGLRDGVAGRWGPAPADLQR